MSFEVTFNSVRRQMVSGQVVIMMSAVAAQFSREMNSEGFYGMPEV
jgi:hypothetical protein